MLRACLNARPCLQCEQVIEIELARNVCDGAAQRCVRSGRIAPDVRNLKLVEYGPQGGVCIPLLQAEPIAPWPKVIGIKLSPARSARMTRRSRQRCVTLRTPSPEVGVWQFPTAVCRLSKSRPRRHHVDHLELQPALGTLVSRQQVQRIPASRTVQVPRRNRQFVDVGGQTQ